ncbi:hypothetical protein [Streptomyces massasporeus]|uniref:hypothetical protein n=1 Tax=Streptomyces massasporeus TaxID=67324 RepID=UPI00380F22A2
MLDNLRVFRAHDQDWREVDQDIVDARERYERIDAADSAELQRSVRDEVATWDATAPIESTTAPVPPSVDPLDDQAMVGVLANAARLAKPAVFDTEVQRARGALEDAPRKPYGQPWFSSGSSPAPCRARAKVVIQLKSRMV